LLQARPPLSVCTELDAWLDAGCLMSSVRALVLLSLTLRNHSGRRKEGERNRGRIRAEALVQKNLYIISDLKSKHRPTLNSKPNSTVQGCRDTYQARLRARLRAACTLWRIYFTWQKSLPSVSLAAQIVSPQPAHTQESSNIFPNVACTKISMRDEARATATASAGLVPTRLPQTHCCHALPHPMSNPCRVTSTRLIKVRRSLSSIHS
jgi:hypothetical protein